MQTTQQAPEVDLSAMIQGLIARLDTKRPDSDLWDTQDIADYMRLSRKAVQNKVVNKEGFPRPRIITEGRKGARRWKAKEVIAWAERR